MCSAKDSKLIDETWSELASILNKNLRDEDEYWSESAYRKKFQQAKAFYDEVFSKKVLNDDYLHELINQKHDIQKEKQKLSDERAELNRLLREQARRESFIDLVKNTLIEDVKPYEYQSYEYYTSKNNDMVIVLTDIHAGIKINNFWNKYDIDVLQSRLETSFNKVSSVQHMHSSEVCHLFLGGDLISGLIHSNLRIENNKNVIEQVKIVSIYLSYYVQKLASIFKGVKVYSVSGNHSRLSPSKEDHLKGEELDALVPFYMQAKLQNQKNVSFIENVIDDTICSFYVRGNLFYGVHGDKDSTSNVVQNLTMMTKLKPYCVLMGHRHTNGLTSVYDTKVVESGCVSGNDNFCINKRIVGSPEQVILICDTNGIDCLYDVQL